MRASVRAFSLEKDGNTPEENQDAFHPPREGVYEMAKWRFAVADGATEAMLSGFWAKVLTRRFCRSQKQDVEMAALLEECYCSWGKRRAAYLQQRARNNKPIQWYEEPALEAGAFATFLGLQFTGPSDGSENKWHCIAVGDACLFQIRADQLEVKFPIESSACFNNAPRLISSNAGRNRHLEEHLRSTKGNWQIGDQFYLMTDALSCWFLGQFESGKAPWKLLCNFEGEDKQRGFQEWVAQLRNSKEIRNDDVTLLRIIVKR